LYCGVPCKLGKGGLEQIVQVELTADERAALQRSAAAVTDTMKTVTL
jgi:malate dehydrogenase